jgi:hypothetical protein
MGIEPNARILAGFQAILSPFSSERELGKKESGCMVMAEAAGWSRILPAIGSKEVAPISAKLLRTQTGSAASFLLFFPGVRWWLPCITVIPEGFRNTHSEGQAFVELQQPG